MVEDYDGDTYRAVLHVKFRGLVFVLHAFQKKSKSGIQTPPHEIALHPRAPGSGRLRLYAEIHRAKKPMITTHAVMTVQETCLPT